MKIQFKQCDHFMEKLRWLSFIACTFIMQVFCFHFQWVCEFYLISEHSQTHEHNFKGITYFILTFLAAFINTGG